MKFSNNKAFTLVELMVVITVIVILSLLSYTTYDALVDNAINAKLAADLKTTYNKIKEYHTENRVYPQSINDCPNPVSGNICIATTDGVTYKYYVDNYSSPKRFSVSTLYNSTYYRVTESVPPYEFGLKRWDDIDAGDYYTCGVTTDGAAYCWGDYDSNFPTPINTSGILSGKTIRSISTNGPMTCVVTTENKLYCWGEGYLGNNTITGSPDPVEIGLYGDLIGKNISTVEVSDEGWHICAIDVDGYLYCWGDGGNGEIGINSALDTYVPTRVNHGSLVGKTVKSVALGEHYTCAITNDDWASCWGFQWYWGGMFGDIYSSAYESGSLVPVAVDNAGALSGKHFKSISAGYNVTCAVMTDNTAYCFDFPWSIYNSEQFIYFNTAAQIDMSGVLAGKTILSIESSPYSVCAIASDNRIYCWSTSFENNSQGTLGTGNTDPSLVPVSVDTSGDLAGKSISFISTGKYHSCVIDNEKKVYCWGSGEDGELGNEMNINMYSPVRMVGP